jgi:hypothetical protein
MAINRGLKPEGPKVDQTPMINGFKMVKETPFHQPATTYKRAMPIEPSPVITWGKIEDTAFLGLEKGAK